MKTMMQVAFVLLAVAVFEAAAQIPGKEVKFCGKTACVDEPGVTCNAKGTGCVCPVGTIGDGRVQCTNPHDHCLCTIHGDPHICNFWGQMFVLPLPCSHVLANLVTPASAGSCKVQVNGRAWYKHPSTLPASFEHVIHVKVVSGPYTLHVKFIGNKKPIKTLYFEHSVAVVSGGGPFPIDISTDASSHYLVVVENCKLALKYRSSDSSFALLTTVGCIDKKGLCGQCNEGWHPHPLSKQLVLQKMLDSLSKNSPIDGNNMNNCPECNVLTDTVKDCPDDRKDFAAHFCGEILINPHIRKCLFKLLGNAKKELLVFNGCYDLVCKVPTCDQVTNNVFLNCASTDHVNTFKAKPGFCT